MRWSSRKRRDGPDRTWGGRGPTARPRTCSGVQPARMIRTMPLRIARGSGGPRRPRRGRRGGRPGRDRPAPARRVRSLPRRCTLRPIGGCARSAPGACGQQRALVDPSYRDGSHPRVRIHSRELGVLRRLTAGDTVAAIATETRRSVGTVRSQVRTLPCQDRHPDPGRADPRRGAVLELGPDRRARTAALARELGPSSAARTARAQPAIRSPASVRAPP